MFRRRQLCIFITVLLGTTFLAGSFFALSLAQVAEPAKVAPAPSRPAETKLTEATPADTKPSEPEDIRQDNPTFLVRADVNHGTRLYRERDILSLTVASEADAYIYALYKQANGNIFLIYPNSEQPDNQVKAKQTVQIPASKDLFRWVIEPPFGKDVIKVIASKEPLPELSDPSLREKFFNPITRNQVKGVELRLGLQTPAWAEDHVEITTYAVDHAVDASGVRRFAVLFGVGEYEFNNEMRAASDGKVEMNVPPCHRDARKLAAILSEVGKFTDVRVYTNDQATRKKVEEALTQWLPSVSRPGDTVLIFFSGLALPLPDEQTESRGGVLATHDFLPPPVFALLMEKAKKVGIPSELAPRLRAAAELVNQAGSKEHKARTLFRATGVDHDVFAHWLQGLAGRQVIVILDTGFAGTFVPPGVASPDTANDAVEGLSNQIGRLKGLGQQEIAFLGACGAQQPNVLRVPEELSLLTHCLVQNLVRAPGPVTLDEAHRTITSKIEELFAEVNRKLHAEGKEPISPYRPCMVNTCSQPVLLKP